MIFLVTKTYLSKKISEWMEVVAYKMAKQSKALQDEMRSNMDDSIAEIKSYHSVTYKELVQLRNHSKLLPGNWYRLVDYMTTVANVANARSAEHPFDLFVLAIAENTLSEEAHAIISNRDTGGYFKKCQLAAWRVWYCLDNDSKHFQWANPNGTGVIYRLIDEHGNDCPYDFKNIQFKRWAITDITSEKLTDDALECLQSIYCIDRNGGKHYATKDVYGIWVPHGDGTSFEIDEGDFGWYYTFHGMSSDDGETIKDSYDSTVRQFQLSNACLTFLENDGCGSDTKEYCKQNIIRPTYLEYFADDEYFKGRQTLNNIVFLIGISYCFYNNEEEYWNWNIGSCCGNSFGIECKYSTFGDHCNYNTFGNSCNNNVFGNWCYYNTFGNYFQWNTFGNDCDSNVFGNWCYDNTFGNGCYSNTFGNGCDYNTFGNYFRWNTFGNGCYYNTFGNGCDSNTFGNGCDYNTFGNDYIKCCTFGNEVQYCSISSYSTGSSYYLQYITVLDGTMGTYSSKLSLTGLAVGARYSQICGFDSSGAYITKNILD